MAAPETPFPWFGGKRDVAPQVWDALGNVSHYVEPFFGSGAVLLRRPHSAKFETVNDVDGLLANFWRAVRADPLAVAHHADWPCNEADLHARHVWLVGQRDIRARFQGELITKQGMSDEQVASLDGTFDIIYIDAGHDYESVMKDATESLKKIRNGGYIIFNDYTMMDHLYGTPYGVVPAANELITGASKLKVVGLGLNPQMFCDLAVKVQS